MKKHAIAIASVITLAASMSAFANPNVVNKGISEAEVLVAQKAWGDALVAISNAHEKKWPTRCQGTCIQSDRFRLRLPIRPSFVQAHFNAGAADFPNHP